METQRADEQKNFLHRSSKRPYWDWFSESPVELVLMAFILIFFFLMPREDCGITPQVDSIQTQNVVTSGHP